MNDNMDFNSDQLIKWLRFLMYVSIVSLVNSLIGQLSIVPSAVTTWISRGAAVAVVVCMFQLSPANARYRKTAILRIVSLILTIISAFVSVSAVLVSSVVSIIGDYQEYNAHSELVAQKDAKLSGRWSSLFLWSLFSGVLVWLVSLIVSLIATFLRTDAAAITSIVTSLVIASIYAIDIAYILYLKKMLVIFDESEGCRYG